MEIKRRDPLNNRETHPDGVCESLPALALASRKKAPEQQEEDVEQCSGWAGSYKQIKGVLIPPSWSPIRSQPPERVWANPELRSRTLSPTYFGSWWPEDAPVPPGWQPQVIGSGYTEHRRGNLLCHGWF